MSDPMPSPRLAVVVLLLARASLGGAAGWPDIPEAERQLTAVAGFPEAGAVVLLERGSLELSGKTLSSYLDVYRRVKVLTADGISHGTVSLLSSDYYRMKDLEARVHLADGKTIPLPKDAKFEKSYSGAYDRTIVSFALPQVAPGAIVEYRYRVYFDSLLYPEPWFFQDVIPTLRSEISCTIPKSFLFKPHLVRTIERKVEQDSKGSATGTTASFWVTDVPPVPDEPGGPPFADLATRVTFLPLAAMDRSRIPLLESWASLTGILQGDRTSGYEFVRKHALSATLRGKKLAEGAAGPAEAAAAIYRFVRDEIANEPFGGMGVAKRGGDDILSDLKGTAVEKALLLQILLDGAGVASSLGFTTHRDVSRVDEALVNPGQFDAVLVVADLGDRRFFMDPTDRSAGFGTLPPTLEGVRCLLVDRKVPEWVTTPRTPLPSSVRKARIELTLSAHGALAGQGTLVLTGHHAWERIGWRETQERTLEAWTKWLGAKLPGYDLEGVEVVESIEDRRVTAAFKLRQRADEVLGKEASVGVAVPLQCTTNPFTLAPDRRRAPVQIAFADRDEVEIVVLFPPGWRVASRPRLVNLDNDAGALATRIDVDEAARRVTLTRQLDVRRADFGVADYPALKALQEAAIANDAESLVLATR